MNKSPINILGAIAGGLLAGRGKKKTARALKKIDKRLGSIESKIDSATSEEQNAVPEIDASMDAVDNSVIENSGSAVLFMGFPFLNGYAFGFENASIQTQKGSALRYPWLGTCNLNFLNFPQV